MPWRYSRQSHIGQAVTDSLLGCLISFVFSERFGRKNPLLVGTTLVIIGAVLQAASYGRVQFIIGRVVGGLGTGLNTSIIPIW